MNRINFMPFPNLTTEHFNLRQLTMEDENEIFTLRSDETILKYLDKPPAKSIEEARQFIEKVNKGIKENEWIYWAVSHKSKTKLCGTICLWNISKDQTKADIGFELLPNYHGKGIMQEVIPVVIDYGFKTMRLNTIEGEVDPNNIKSIKLMEKFGFVYNRKLDTTVIYSLVNETDTN